MLKRSLFQFVPPQLGGLGFVLFRWANFETMMNVGQTSERIVSHLHSQSIYFSGWKLSAVCAWSAWHLSIDERDFCCRENQVGNDRTLLLAGKHDCSDSMCTFDGYRNRSGWVKSKCWASAVTSRNQLILIIFKTRTDWNECWASLFVELARLKAGSEREIIDLWST